MAHTWHSPERSVREAHFTETFVSFVPSWCTSYT